MAGATHLHKVILSSRNSDKDFPPTFSLTFSKEEGETTEKQTKKTSVCG